MFALLTFDLSQGHWSLSRARLRHALFLDFLLLGFFYAASPPGLSVSTVWVFCPRERVDNRC